MSWYEKTKQLEKINLCTDLTKSELLVYLHEKDIYKDFPFLLDKNELDTFYEWVTTYLEDIEFIHSTFDGWVCKYCIQRQKRINGGF